MKKTQLEESLQRQDEAFLKMLGEVRRAREAFAATADAEERAARELAAGVDRLVEQVEGLARVQAEHERACRQKQVELALLRQQAGALAAALGASSPAAADAPL